MGRMEIMTGRERRRRWSAEAKLSILEEAARPGISAAAVARRHDILPEQLYAWRRRYRHTGSSADGPISFLPVELVHADGAGPETTAQPARTPDARVEIVCRNGRAVRIDAGMDVERLGALIRAVEAA